MEDGQERSEMPFSGHSTASARMNSWHLWSSAHNLNKNKLLKILTWVYVGLLRLTLTRDAIGSRYPCGEGIYSSLGVCTQSVAHLLVVGSTPMHT